MLTNICQHLPDMMIAGRTPASAEHRVRALGPEAHVVLLQPFLRRAALQGPDLGQEAALALRPRHPAVVHHEGAVPAPARLAAELAEEPGGSHLGERYEAGKVCKI